MTRQRANREGSIFPYRNGYAAYVWVTRPDGQRQRKGVRQGSRGSPREMGQAACPGATGASVDFVSDARGVSAVLAARGG